jgi:hypothetical protein
MIQVLLNECFHVNLAVKLAGLIVDHHVSQVESHLESQEVSQKESPMTFGHHESQEVSQLLTDGHHESHHESQEVSQKVSQKVSQLLTVGHHESHYESQKVSTYSSYS